ncbi:af7315f0-ec30-42a7-8ece-5fccc6a70508 [Sclerotinia trifoliorum]|uniref:Structural maintenance of chromosomes protein 5 n=1 Tax=Sclerotinia trifoliorum TaxID=28548 RepID=A0A8H2ZQ45_9HELO|nr:af7315f0-ec30-42a7-8ece-5fccc6a70508 [Sclerotinia trifoliorum]
MASRRRRSRAEVDDDDSSENPTPAQSAKRSRTIHYESEEGTSRPDTSPSSRDEDDRRKVGSISDSPTITSGRGKFAPGAIVRVKLNNFVTYESAEFFPGPNLNMVIGPNGTGKSSLVCALCLGLGSSPKNLGRADKVGEFVKHGSKDAFIEIELQKRSNERENHIIKTRILKDGNNCEFWISNKRASHKNVLALVNGFSIQIDNLCQFLPQDKVSEFAALTPVELLHHTQRAVAAQEMLDWHDELKNLRKEEKSRQMQLDLDKEQLANLEKRQAGLRPEMERLEERIQIEKNLEKLKNSIPFVEYRQARLRHKEFRDEKIAATKRFRTLEGQVEPTLRLVNKKDSLEKNLAKVVSNRKKNLQLAEAAADELLKKVEEWDDKIGDCDRRVKVVQDAEDKRKKDLAKVRRAIIDLEARLREPEIEFNAAEYNQRIRAVEQDIKAIQARIQELQESREVLRAKGRDLRAEQDRAKQDLADFDSQAGRQINKIAQHSRDTAIAWKWVQDNPNKFEKEVYGPPLITCSVKDPRYTDAVESLFRQSNMLTITAQTQADYKLLNDQFHSAEMRLAEVRTQMSTQTLAETIGRPSATIAELNSIGLDGWAIDFIDAPEPVLAMLCNDIRAHRTAVTLQDVTEEQHERIIRAGITSFVTKTTTYKITTRREYNASSTQTSGINRARFFIDGVVDTSGRRMIEENLQELGRKFEALKKENEDISDKIEQYSITMAPKKDEKDAIIAEKQQKQKAYGEQRALPGLLAREKESLERLESSSSESRAEIQLILKEQDVAGLKKGGDVMKHIEQIDQIMACSEGLDEAEARRIEADSDTHALRERNRDIVANLDAERTRLQEIEAQSKLATETARIALDACKQLRREAEERNDIESLEYFSNISEDRTVESLQQEINSEEHKLNYIQANNPNAIREYEKRQVDISRLNTRITGTESELGDVAQKVTQIMRKWEPKLDALIEQISQAFSHNFEQIGCAGEVGVYKEDDFEKWAIEIKVKFRENETLQLLDKHRQSGGERSVSTIFYLMSLQSLARSPFRVVDEINQGMDPRNERMVHGRMVEIACQEHDSQYFLITPKLLHDLKYHPRMKVLVIVSGEHMPDDHTNFSVKGTLETRRRMRGIAAA